MRLSMLLFISGIFCANSDTVSNSKLAHDIIKSLLSLLNYTENYLHLMNLDGIYGMTLAEANLNAILELPLDPVIRESIEILEKGIHDVKKQGQKIVKDSFKDSHLRELYLKMEKILNADLWATPNSTVWKNELVRLKPKWENFYFMEGLPTEKQSDFCISQMLKTNEKVVKPCPLHDSCLEIYMDTRTSHGYSLTHKALFWVVFDRMKCFDYYSSKTLRMELCSRVLSEFEGIMEMKPFLRVLSDLVLEQVVICGTDGHSEFFKNRKWIELVLSWQNEFGCFPAFRPDESFFVDSSKRRRKRESSYMSHGCENHITGLSFAYLALNLKYLLSTQQNLIIL